MNKTTEFAAVALFGIFLYFMYSAYTEYLDSTQGQLSAEFKKLQDMILDLAPKKETTE